MLKKFLAGLTTIALSLGMVALTAGPASAHHNTINAVVSCNTGDEGTWKVTWSVTNSESDKNEEIIQSSDETLIPVGTEIKKGKTATFVEYFDAPTSKTLTLTGEWSNGVTQQNSGSVSSGQFSSDCLPDDTDDKIEICHATASDSNPYTSPEVSKDSIITHDPNGHGTHPDDIIPPFNYVKQGVSGSYPGQNWDAYGQAVYAAGCDKPTATPTAPTFTEAECLAAGQPGQASYVIPVTTGVKYTVQINGAGGFVDAIAGTYYVAGGTTVEVKAVALTGYKLGTPNSWSKTFAVKDCIVITTPAAATFSTLECVDGVATQPSYTIPSTTGVTYTVQLNGAGGFVVKTAGTYPVAQGTQVEVVAVAQAGYSLTGQQQWSKTFGTVDCRVTPTAPDFTAAVCTPDDRPGSYSDASYTIPATTGVQYQVRFAHSGPWTDIAAGTHSISAGGYVQVRAVATGAYVLTGTVKWTHDFDKPDCLTDVIPTAPSYEEAVCTGEQQVGSASFTIPDITGVKYQRATGPFTWVDVAPGVNQVVDGTLLALRAIPLPGYEFPGAQVRLYGHLFDNFDLSKDCLVPTTPTSDPQECEGPGEPSQASYTVPSDTGVRYELWDGDSWETATAGDYDVNSFPTIVKLRAVPKHGYSFLPSAVTEWTFEFTSAGDCITSVPVQPVVGADQECVVDDLDTGDYHNVSGTITIPNTPHVTYYIDGVATASGVHDVEPGVYTISATAEAGYALTGVPDPWTVEIEKAFPCGLQTFPTVTPTVTFAQTTCSASGSYTLVVDPAELAAGVIWTVSAGLPTTVGTHAVNTAGTVTVIAVPAPGYGFGDGLPGPAIREWSFGFASLPDDCLPTLALTGGGLAAGGLGLAGLLTVAGVLMVSMRRRETVNPD
jgi:hypothetical protein